MPSDSACRLGAILEPDDVDIVRVAVESENTDLVVTSVDFGGGLVDDANHVERCVAGVEIDLQVLDAEGDFLAMSEQPPPGACAEVALDGLTSGDYHVRISGAESTEDVVYVLNVAKRVCGDGVIDLGELRDDNNEVSGDGGSAACLFE